MGGMIKKMIPKVAKDINSHVLDESKGEKMNVLVIKMPEEGEMEMYKATVAMQEGMELPVLTRLEPFEMKGEV